MSVSAPSAQTPSGWRRNPFASASIVAAAVVLVISLIGRIVALAAPAIQASAHLSVAALGVLFAAVGAAGVVVALAAAVLGAIGVTRPGLPHGLAAAGLAVGITAVAGYVLPYLAGVVFAAMLAAR